MNDETYYPKFQYSVFRDGSRDEQLVVRADDFEEFKNLKKQLDLILTNGSSQNGEAHNQASKTMKCMQCGGEARYREGVSKKTDKPYKGVFCLDRSCNHARFL